MSSRIGIGSASLCKIFLAAILGFAAIVLFGCEQESQSSESNDIPVDTPISDILLASKDIETADNDPIVEESEALVQIEIRNGSMVEGAAAAMQLRLVECGFEPTVSPTQWPIIDNTWIVYKKVALAGQAKELADALGATKAEFFCVSENPSAWSLPADISILVGLDWVNANMLEEGQDPYLNTGLRIN